MPISSLTNQYISSSFQYLMQVSSSGEIFDGAGNQINTLKVTSISGVMASASFATTASYISPTFISASAAASGFGSGGGGSVISAFTVTASVITGSVLGLAIQDYTDVPGGTVSITNTVSCSIYVGATFIYNFLDSAGTPQNGQGDRHRLLFDNVEVYEVFPVQPFPGDFSETITYTAYNIAPGTHTAKLQIYNPDTVVGQYSASYFGPGQIHAIVLAGAQGPSGSQGPAGGAVLNGPNTFTGTQTINGDVVITGTATALQYVVSSSVYYVTTSYMSGSTKFGDTQDDTHQFTGSLNLSGSHSGILPNLYHYGINQYSDNSLSPAYAKRWYATPFFGQTWGGQTFTANCIYVNPFVINASRTISQMAIKINTISYTSNTASFSLGIYDSTANVYPRNIITSGSAISHNSGDGVKFISGSVNTSILNPGVYWLALFISGTLSENITPQFVGGNVSSNFSHPMNIVGYTESDQASTAISTGLVYPSVSESFESGFPITFPITGSVNLTTNTPWIGVYFSA